jgi:putative hydrolase of the HAD superfamily
MYSEREIIDLIINKNIRHISFDYWNTIYFSNPEFKKERGLYLSRVSQLDTDVVQIAVAELSKLHNERALAKKELVNSEDLNYMLFDKIKIKNNKSKILLHLYELFQKYPPIIRNEFPSLIKKIHDYKITFSILSNTAFIPGKEIRKVLAKDKLLEYFTFFQFSDEVGFGKPAKSVFEEMKNKIKSIDENIVNKEILHIGDDINFDIYPAIENGIETLKV